MKYEQFPDRINSTVGQEVSRASRAKWIADEWIRGIFAVIHELMAEGEDVAIPGFGKFSIVERAPRTGRNPQTGKAMKIPAKKVVKFTPAKFLKEAVAGGK
jgi:DNA-binding protein HU-beta